MSCICNYIISHCWYWGSLCELQVCILTNAGGTRIGFSVDLTNQIPQSTCIQAGLVNLTKLHYKY